MLGMLSAARITSRLRPYVAAVKPPTVKGKRWFVEAFFPKTINYRPFFHKDSIRHVFRRPAIEGGIDHRVIIGCPVVDPATGKKTRVVYKADKRTKERYPTCSVSPITLNIWHPDTKAEREKVKRIIKDYGKDLAKVPNKIGKAILSRQRNLVRIENLIERMRGRKTTRKRTRKVAGLSGARGGRRGGIGVGLTIALVGLGALVTWGIIGSFTRKTTVAA